MDFSYLENATRETFVQNVISGEIPYGPPSV